MVREASRFLLSTALVVTLALPGFAAQPAEGEKLADNQEYNFWLLDAIKTLDPQKNTDAEGSDVLRQLFEGLMTEDGQGAMKPGVATGYDVSEDGLGYVFHLRPEAKWSNGDPVTAHDFVYAWRRLADPATASEYAWFIELMNVENATDVVKGDKTPDQLGVTATDDHTLQVRLSKATPYFIKTLSHASTFPVSQKAVEAHGDQWTQPGNIVTNGAFTLDSNDLGSQIVMTKSEPYWDSAATILTRVRAITVNDNNVALTRYQAGELDRVQIPAGQYPRLKEESPDQAISVPYGCSYAYLFNLSDKGPEALKDLRVRQALSYAVDRDIIVDRILQGGQKPSYFWTHWATEGFEAPDIPYAHWTQAERVEKARALLAEAGYGEGNPLKLTIQYNTDENHKKLAVAVQQFWKAIGVQVTLSNYEWKVHTDRLQNQDFQVARYAWCADYNEPSTFLDFFRSEGYNNGKWSNAEYDALLAQSVTADDTAGLYRQAEQILSAEMAMVPVYHYAKVDMIKPDLRGIPTGNLLNNWYARDIYRVVP